MTPFVPLFRSPHLQTIAGHVWPRPRGGRFPIEKKLYQTEPGVQVLVETRRPRVASRGDIVLVHGLEGASAAGYIRSLSLLAAQRGYTAHGFNMRAGYHGGLTCDLLAVLRALEREGRAPVWLVGFSLGGNLVAKLAGELGGDARTLIAGVCAASAAIDLEACALRVGEPDNRFYEWRFVRQMSARARVVWRSTPADLRGIRSLFEMDDRITAPAFGFHGALDYYRTQSANQFLDRIRVPALFITSQDDTFIPFRIYDQPAFRTNPCLRLVATECGGHVGFIAKHRPHLWLDHAIMEWLEGGKPDPLRVTLDIRSYS